MLRKTSFSYKAPAREIAPHNSPIFIGGAGRSGTSPLRTILNAHPRIAIGAELKVHSNYRPILTPTVTAPRPFGQALFNLTGRD